MSVSGVKIRFVPYLEPEDIAAKDFLPLCDDLQSQVRGIV